MSVSWGCGNVLFMDPESKTIRCQLNIGSFFPPLPSLHGLSGSRLDYGMKSEWREWKPSRNKWIWEMRMWGLWIREYNVQNMGWSRKWDEGAENPPPYWSTLLWQWEINQWWLGLELAKTTRQRNYEVKPPKANKHWRGRAWLTRSLISIMHPSSY